MCLFPAISWKKSETYSIYGNNADLIFLMVSQNVSTKYLEMMPQPITVSEYQQPFHYCW